MDDVNKNKEKSEENGVSIPLPIVENLIQLTEYDVKEYQKEYRKKLIDEYYANHKLRCVDLKADLNLEIENIDEYYRDTYTDSVNSLKDLVDSCMEFMRVTRLLFVIRIIKHGTYADFVDCIIECFTHIPRRYEEETTEERMQFIYGLYDCIGIAIKINAGNMTCEEKEKLLKQCLDPIKTLKEIGEKSTTWLYISIEDWQKILSKLGLPGVYLYLKKYINDVEKLIIGEWERCLRNIKDILKYIDKGLLIDNIVLSNINILLSKKT